ncbi:MAG: hypothetical protein RLZZ241_916 [Bacteroidota bacterium]
MALDKAVLSGLLLFFCNTLESQNLPTSNNGNSDFTVVLDAGHGGFDPGNLGNGYLEKEITLNIVKEVGRQLANSPGIKVVYTRESDTFIDLYVRGQIANKAKADLFVSVHCDAHNSSAQGAGTFVLGLHANQQNFEIAKKENSVIYLEDDYETRYADYDINSPESVIGLTIMQEEFLDQSIQFAKLVQDELAGELSRTDRKVKQAGFIVLHQTFMPSALIETGFLTNRNEGAYLNSIQGQRDMGRGIANAIIAYRNGVRPVPQTANQGKAQPTSAAGGVANGVANEKTPNEQEVVQVSKQITSENLPKKEASATPIKLNNPQEKDRKEQAEAQTNVFFRIQLLALSKAPTFKEPEFEGLPFLAVESYNKIFRVLFGNTANYEEAQRLKVFAVQKGFAGAYIVAYKDGNRVQVSDVLPK